MKDIFNVLHNPVSQAEFSRIVGRSAGRVSQWATDGTLAPDASLLEWLQAVIDRLSGEAAGRYSSGELDLSQERAALARVQRQLAEEKLALARGASAPVELLAMTLAAASAAVAQRLDALPAVLRKRCPSLPRDATDAVVATVAAARNEWVRQTMELVAAAVSSAADDDQEVDAEGQVQKP